ncbi:MAG: alanyl-tRNA editing protein [Eubacteriales bacterium]|nr:alanyl-tRNA editing protein [Eubacteriales bacterium]
MSTAKLYQQNVYIKEWDTEIESINENGVYLCSTAFFPEGGGQSCDIGSLAPAGEDTDRSAALYKITDVQEDGDDIVHKIVCDDGSTFELKAGDKVHCTLDWDRRFDNMQRHCGEHILSGIFYRECGGVNRGFHMGQDYMTVDISLEDKPTNPEMEKPEEITWELAKHCELLANRVIWSDAPVKVFRYDNREDAENMPLRKNLALDEDISIVCIGSPENAADCVACCGTHPQTAGQVGLIKLYKVEKYKGMFRIYFEAGKRALMDYSKKHDILTDLSNSYSSSIEDFPEKIRGQEEKLADVKNQLFHIKKAFIENECNKLNDLLTEAEESSVLVYPLENLSLDDAFNMSKEYMGKSACKGKLILLYSVPDTSYILVSDGEIKCGPLVKEYANFYGGKGGGNDISARAIFKTSDDASLFADLLGKHLK